MDMTTAVKSRKAFSRIAFFGLLLVTMMAATLHLGAFSAQAAQAGLAWSATTTNADGTPATDLAGYKLHIGNASRSYQQKIDLGKVTNYTVSNLTDGSTYYFALTAYNTAGSESSFSNEVSKNFPALAVTHLITASAGSGGTITALNNTKVNVATNGTTTISNVTVNDGANQAFSIAAATGYGITDVKVDGTSVGAVASYSFSTVKAGHTISATFAASVAKSYTITASAGTGGTITPSGSATLTAGASKSYTIAAAAGYSIAGVTVDGASMGPLASYNFTNLSANHTIAASFTASNTGTSTGSSTFAVNSGGPQFASSTAGTYLADTRYSGGSVGTTTAAISGTTDDALYQRERFGNFSYSIPVSNGNYAVTLKFAEIYFSAAGQRVFDVTINGQTVASSLDLYAKAGKNVAYDMVIPVSVTNGAININFISKVNNAKVSAIRVAPGAAPAPAPATGSVVFASNGGGSQYASSTGVTYLADTKYSGGSTASTTATISGTTDGALYRSERYGNFSYNVPMANGNYQVTLKFAETYWAATGKRVFSVKLNGTTVVSNLDIYAKVGKNAAYDVVIPVSVTNGALNIGFVTQVDNAKVSAILVKSM